MKKIMFVCHGNICRSPMAEFMLKDMFDKLGISDEYEVQSCATSTEELGNPIHYGTRKMLLDKNIPFTEREAVQLKKSDYNEYDMFICMDKRNIRNAQYVFGEDPEQKIHLLMDFTNESKDVADPWWTHNFDETYNDIKKGLEGLLKTLGE